MKGILGIELVGDTKRMQFEDSFRYCSKRPRNVPKKAQVFKLIKDEWIEIGGTRDYTYSNGSGNKGIFKYYILESGNLYKVIKPISWYKSITYFCKVSEEGDIIKILEEEVKEWINTKENNLE